MSRISIFGLSASGKTCFLYAMSQVLGAGVRNEGSFLQIISTRSQQQVKLNRGYMQLAQRRWPESTAHKAQSFFFKVNFQCNGFFGEIIDSLELMDYRGGLLESTQEFEQEEYEGLLNSFRGASAVIFIIDGQTLIDALPDKFKDISHKDKIDVLEQFKAQSQIRFIENIFMEYKLVEKDIPPVMLAISKGDLFASNSERDAGISLLCDYLPSIFAHGSGVTAGITIMSLGEGLGTNSDGALTGALNLTTDFNIHVPLTFGIYADVCDQYNLTDDPREKQGIETILPALRKMFANRVRLFINGHPAKEKV